MVGFTQSLNSDLLGEEYDIADFYNRTSHRFEDMVQHCQWKAVDCEKTSWEEDYTHYSKCYTFNKNGDHKLLKAGSGKIKNHTLIRNLTHDLTCKLNCDLTCGVHLN